MAAALARDLVPEAEAVVDLTLRELARLHLLESRLIHVGIDRRGPGAGCSGVAWRRRCCRRSTNRGAVARGRAVAAAAAGRSNADELLADQGTPGHHGRGHRDRKQLRDHGGRERDRRHAPVTSRTSAARRCESRSPLQPRPRPVPGNVTMTTPGGTSNALPLTVNTLPPPGAPTLTSVSPDEGTPRQDSRGHADGHQLHRRRHDGERRRGQRDSEATSSSAADTSPTTANFVL